MNKKKVWTGIGLFIVVLIIIFAVKLQTGPVENEVMSKMSADFLSNRFKMPFEVTKIKYRFNENRSFYEVTSNPIGKPAVKVKIGAYPPPKDNKGKISSESWHINGDDYANILWGKKVNEVLKPLMNNIFMRDFVFYCNITPVPVIANGFILARFLNMVDTYVEKQYKDFNFDTQYFIFIEENKLDLNKESEKIYLLIKELSREPWLQKQWIGIRYFNQSMDVTVFKTVNKELMKNYLLGNKEKNIYSLNLTVDDIKLIKSAEDLTNYFKKMEE